MKPYERFEAWQRCHQLTLETYRATANWPKHETYGLTSQARRAAAAAATNLAERSAKRGPREFRRYLDVSLGSLAELSYLFRLATDLGYLTATEHEALETLRNDAGRLTWGLYRSLKV